MIVSCEKCNKKFELNINLIPQSGRILQCGSCSHQWHYKPKSKSDKKKQIKLLDKKVIVAENKIINKPTKTKNIENNQKIASNKPGILSYLLIYIISFFALILVLETFKMQISNFVPNLDFYLSSLYESIKDVLLFFKDLLK